MDERFGSIVKGMQEAYHKNMRVACLQLTNAIISTPDDLDFRIHLRNEFWRAGLVDIIEVGAYPTPTPYGISGRHTVMMMTYSNRH